MDKVILKNIRFDLVVGLDAWRRWEKPQPVALTLEVQPASNFEAAAAKDDVGLTVDYGKLYKKLSIDLLQSTSFTNIQALVDRLSALVADYHILDIDILLPKALLQAQGGVLYRSQLDRSASDFPASSLSMTIKEIACSCIIGVNAHERIYKQTLFLDISVPIVASVSLVPEDSSVRLHDMVQEVVTVSCHVGQTCWNPH